MSNSKTPQSFYPKSEKENVKSFADLLPINKELWISGRIPGSNLYILLASLSKELARFQALEYQLASQYIPNATDSFIEYWEHMLGIPDTCFKTDVPDDERRANILIKLAYLTLQTAEDYELLGAMLGLNVQVLPNIPNDPFIWTINVNSNDPNTFPFTFPMIFSENKTALFQCLVNKQKPAHTQVLFQFEPNAYVTTDNDEYVDGNDEIYVDGGTFL